jgi:nuclear GTP-binding protein
MARVSKDELLRYYRIADYQT